MKRNFPWLKRAAFKDFASVTRLGCAVVLSAIPTLLPPSSNAAIVAVETTTADNQTALTSISLDDGRIIPVGEMIGITVTHFRTLFGTTGLILPGNENTPPTTGNRAALLGDVFLNTGLLGIGSGDGLSPTAQLALTPGVAFTFSIPVVNGPGDDVILFEEQSTTGLTGNPVIVSRLSGGNTPLNLGPTYQVSVPLAPIRFATLPSVSSLTDFENVPLGTSIGPFTGYKAQGIAFDLSSLGYAPGALVPGLFIQDFLSGSDTADPVFIAGLPPTPEPGTPALFLLGAVLSSWLRMRRS